MGASVERGREGKKRYAVPPACAAGDVTDRNGTGSACRRSDVSQEHLDRSPACPSARSSRPRWERQNLCSSFRRVSSLRKASLELGGPVMRRPASGGEPRSCPLTVTIRLAVADPEPLDRGVGQRRMRSFSSSAAASIAHLDDVACQRHKKYHELANVHGNRRAPARRYPLYRKLQSSDRG